MKYKGTLMAAASGKLGGVVASHNAGGQYFRQFVIPTNPSSTLQQATRASLGNMAQAWQQLTGIQRGSWQQYAELVPLTDVLGDSIKVSGFNMFLRSNIPRSLQGLPIVSSGPTVYDLGEVGALSVSAISEATQDFAINFDDTQAWVDEDDAALLVYASRPQSPTIQFFVGPYNFAGKVDGDSVTPPTDPATINSPFVITAGQGLFLRANVSRADGRLSQSFRFSGTVGA